MQFARYGTAAPWEKMAMLNRLNRAVRQLALAGLRQRYPDATEVELRRHLADLLLGPELAQRVFNRSSEQAA